MEPFAEEKLAIKNDSDDSQATIDNENRIIPRDDKLEIDEDMPLDEYFGEDKLAIKGDSDDSQSTIDNDDRIVPHDDKLELSDMPSAEEKLAIKDDSDDSQSTIDNETRVDMSYVKDEPSSDESLPLIKKRRTSITESVESDTLSKASDIHDLPRLPFSSSSEEMDVDNFKQEKASSDRYMSGDKQTIPVTPLLCPICRKKFDRKSMLDIHIKTHHKTNKHTVKKCVFCGEKPTNMSRHIKSEHSFSCKFCKKRFKFQTELAEHISIEHPSCDECNKMFLSKRELLVHQKEHPRPTFVPDESSDDSSEDEDEELNEGDPGYRREDRDFKEHINCVTVKKFSIIRDLIKKNDFKSLAKDKELLESLGLIMHGVKRGFIPICSIQRLVLTKSQKELLYRIARNPSGRLVMKERRDLSLLFDVLWKSVKYVADAFQEYDK